MIRTLFKAILVLNFSFLPITAVHAEDADMAELFQQRGVKGTVVITSLDGENEYIHNASRANKKFIPASTFKIPNTLIALEEGAVGNEKKIIKWDGKDKGWSAWNKDQSLETAFPISCVWFYQELASRIGNASYLSHLKKLDYGNKKTGPNVTTFWLEGELKISAIEQIEFLKRLYQENLPYKKSHINILKKIMIAEKTPQYIIRAKTGWATRINPQHGWYVGYIETNKHVWFFATNIGIKNEGDAKFRKEITMEALKLKNILQSLSY